MRYYKVWDETSKYYGRTGKDVGSINNYTNLEFSDRGTEFFNNKYLQESNQRSFHEKELHLSAPEEDISQYEFVEINEYKFQRIDK